MFHRGDQVEVIFDDKRRDLRQWGKPPMLSGYDLNRITYLCLGRYAKFQRLGLGISYDRECVANLNRDARHPRQGLGNSRGSEKIPPSFRSISPVFWSNHDWFEKLELSTINLVFTASTLFELQPSLIRSLWHCWARRYRL